MIGGFLSWLLLRWRVRFSDDETLRFYLHLHREMMECPRFWYDENLRKADAIFCRAASDLRASMRGAKK